MLIDPRHLEHLAIIIDVGTLQLAAVKIGTSQPALSRMISTLEKRIEAPLFERSTRPLRPTAMGLELAQQGRSIRTARLRAAEVVDLGARGYLGILKLGAPPFLCKNLMSEAIASFLSARPNVRIDLIPDYQVGLMERVYLNQVDIVVGPSKFVAVGDPDLTLDPLFKDRNSIVGRKDHPLIKAPSLSATDFSNVTWVGHSERSTLRADMETSLRQIGVIDPTIACHSGSAEAVLELLRRTDFLTVLPHYAMKSDASDGLAVADFKIPSQELEINAISLASRVETTLATEFKQHLKAHVPKQFFDS